MDTVKVRILVLDENDHRPHFPKLHYRELITTQPEPGTAVAMVTAVDKDAGRKKELRYFLVSGFGHFFKIDRR